MNWKGEKTENPQRKKIDGAALYKCQLFRNIRYFFLVLEENWVCQKHIFSDEKKSCGQSPIIGNKICSPWVTPAYQNPNTQG